MLRKGVRKTVPLTGVWQMAHWKASSLQSEHTPADPVTCRPHLWQPHPTPIAILQRREEKILIKLFNNYY